MDGSVALVKTSLAGSIELFALCAGGAILARKNILDKAACSSWSKGMYRNACSFIEIKRMHGSYSRSRFRNFILPMH